MHKRIGEGRGNGGGVGVRCGFGVGVGVGVGAGVGDGAVVGNFSVWTVSAQAEIDAWRTRE